MYFRKMTIKDVAKVAGCSVTTVSMVLNGKTNSISQITRDKVFAAARELDYVPNSTAKSLVRGKTKMIGVIVPSITNFFFAELVRLLQKNFSDNGYDIILSHNEENAEQDFKYIELLSRRNIDGLIFTPSADILTEKYVEELKNSIEKLNIPYLFLDRYLPDFPRVSIDNEASAYKMMEYLFEKGHRKIGVISGPMQLSSNANRMKGVRKKMSELHIDFSSEYVYEGEYNIETGEKGAEYFLSTDVTAIFTFSDMQAYGVYKKLKEMGKKVPEDISVVGFDDNVYSALLDKPLTTMHQPLDKLAQSAVDIMINMIDHNTYKTMDKIEATLVERESVKENFL